MLSLFGDTPHVQSSHIKNQDFLNRLDARPRIHHVVLTERFMIARVTLELALRKEFDYLIPEELDGQVELGSRVQVPFGSRKVLGCVTGMAEESGHSKLRPILKVLGDQALVTPKILNLARWLADYYCC